MKLLIFHILLLLSVLASAQEDFSLYPIPASIDSTAPAETLIAHAMIKNHRNETIVIAWRRMVNDIPNQWESYICSNITCAPPDVSMGTFSLTAGDSTNLDCYFNTEELPGTASVELQLFNADDSTQMLYATYNANASPSTSNQEVLSAPISFHPIPTGEYLFINSPIAISRIEIYDLRGQILPVVYDDNRIDLSNIPIGIYTLIAYDQANKPLQAERILVNR